MRVTFEGSNEEIRAMFGNTLKSKAVVGDVPTAAREEAVPQREKRTYTRRRKRASWTPEETRTLLLLYGQGKSYRRIGRVLHRTAKAVNVRLVHLRRNGLLKNRRVNRPSQPPAMPHIKAPPREKSPKVNWWTPEEEQRVIMMVHQGVSKRDIAKAIGRNPVFLSIKIRDIAKRLGWKKGLKGSWLPA